MKVSDNIAIEFFAKTGQWKRSENEQNLLIQGTQLLGELCYADFIHLIKFEDNFTARVVHSSVSGSNYLLNPSPILNLLIATNHKVIFSNDLPGIRIATQNLLSNAESAVIIPLENGQFHDLVILGWKEKKEFGENFKNFIEVATQRLAELNEVERLRQREDTTFARFTAIVQTISQAVVLIDNQGFPGWVNQKAADLLELNEWGEQKPQTLAIAMAKFRNAADNKAELEKQAADLFSSGGRISDWVWKFTETSGKIFSVSCSIVTDNMLIGRLWVFEDITFSYLANEKLKEMNSQLELETKRADEENKAKTDFLSNMSHEIRTPMNGIIGMANLLSETPLTDDQKGYLSTIQDSSENLLVIINDILDYNKIIAGKIDLEKIEFSIQKVIDNTINLLKFRAVEKNLDLHTNISIDISTNRFKGDPYRLSQILINLIGNSIKFTQKGIIELRAGFSSRNGSNCTIRFEIIDTGIGIDPNKLDSMFERFSQAEAGTTRKYGGTGLGLAITKQLVDLHQGEISVSSTLGKGSVFTVDIPYEVLQSDKSIAGKDVVKDLENLANKKILLVEDNRVNQKVASLTLQKWGMQVSVAENGIEAIEKLAEQSFDLILMDLQMPEMNGFETTRHIRGNKAMLNHNTPIVAMTASAMTNEKNKCYDAGMNGYLSKPFQIDDLYSTLIQFID